MICQLDHLRAFRDHQVQLEHAMAPSSTGDGGISADADDDAKATHRKRSVTELKRDVLSLVRDTCRSQSSGSESRLDAKYECFHGACRAWLPTMLHPHGGDNSSADGSDDRLTLVPKKEKQQAQLMWSQLNALTDFVMHHRERQKLVGVVAQSIQATQIIARRRRKRKLPTAAAVGGAAPSEDLHCVVEFVTVWMLHTSGILRLEDVLQSVASSGATSTSAYDWMTAPVRYLLSSKAVYLPLASSPLASTQLLAATTHDLVEHVMTYVIRLAFADSVKIPFGGGEAHSTRTGQHLSDARRKVAVRVLEELSSFTSAAFSLPSLCLVTQILASKSAFHKPQQRPNPRSGADGDRCEDGSRFGRMSISKDRVIAFLQPQISKFVSPYSKAQGAYTHEELNQIFSAYQSCLPTSAFVQVFCVACFASQGYILPHSSIV